MTFKLTVPAPIGLWMMLGEAASKCEHLAGVALRPDVAEGLNRIYLAKGVLATTAIEGNTLTEEQVLKQIDGTLELPPSQQYLQQEAKNIVDACNLEVAQDQARSGRQPILSEALIKGFNAQVLRDLEVDQGVVPGEYRSHSVTVGNVYRGAPAQECPYLIARLCEWLNGPDFQPPEVPGLTARDLNTPFAFLKAVVAHLYLAWIHPFGDGNGRTARLLEFHLLYSHGIPLPAAHLLSDHYNLTRSKYYRELDQASRSGGDLIPFIKYAVQGFLDGIRAQIEVVQEHQMGVAWENYVFDEFSRVRSSITQGRRRRLVLTLGRLKGNEWVATTEAERLTPEIAMDYARTGERTLARDLNSLERMGLIGRQYGKVRALTEKMLSFRPARATRMV